MPQSWSIGIMCYNEEGAIRQVIADTVRVATRLAGTRYEIFVVNDCSTDSSKKIILECVDEFIGVKLVDHPVNLGIGGALRSIYAHAQKENVVAICGDGQFDVEELLGKPEFDNREFISYYRLQNTEYNGFRNFLSFFNKWFNQYLLKIYLHDVNWVKVYKTEVIRRLDLKLQSSLVESEICSKLMHAGARPTEYQSRYLPRTSGVSKGSSWRIVRKAVADMAGLFLEVRRFNRVKGAELKLIMGK